MAKNFSKGIDKVFSSTVEPDSKQNVLRATVQELEGKEVKGLEPLIKPVQQNNKPKEELASYNLRYPKELKKRVKSFCIENEGVDMRDVFIEGATMFMENYNRIKS